MCLFVCLFVCFFACLLACLPACLPAWLPGCLPACLPACLLACLLARSLARSLACLFVCLLVLLVRLFCLFVCLLAHCQLLLKNKLRKERWLMCRDKFIHTQLGTDFQLAVSPAARPSSSSMRFLFAVLSPGYRFKPLFEQLKGLVFFWRDRVLTGPGPAPGTGRRLWSPSGRGWPPAPW